MRAGSPEGMTYAEEVVPAAEERALIHYIGVLHIGMLPLKPFEFVGGLKRNRKVISFGWRDDWGAQTVLLMLSKRVRP